MLDKGFTVSLLLEPAMPAPTSWFPLPWGWYAACGLLLVSVLIMLFLRFARWRRNLWRRQAITMLYQQHDVDSWVSLIKRILLVHNSRALVSRCHDPETLLIQIPIDEDLRQLLCDKYCHSENTLNFNQTVRLRHQLNSWLKGLPYV